MARIRDGIVVLDQWTTREKVAAALQELLAKGHEMEVRRCLSARMLRDVHQFGLCEELETGRMSEGRNVRFGGSTQLLKWPLDPEKEL